MECPILLSDQRIPMGPETLNWRRLHPLLEGLGPISSLSNVQAHAWTRPVSGGVERAQGPPTRRTSTVQSGCLRRDFPTWARPTAGPRSLVTKALLRGSQDVRGDASESEGFFHSFVGRPLEAVVALLVTYLLFLFQAGTVVSLNSVLALQINDELMFSFPFSFPW